jgi:hypothetical protein
MATSHTVRLGDCIGSLASHYGFPVYKTIYDDGANAALKGQRPNPNVLVEGDIVSIPDKAVKEVPASTGRLHKFKVAALNTLLRIVVQDDQGAAIGSKKYKLTVGGKAFEGRTAADGKIEHPIEAEAAGATLELWLKEGAGLDGFLFDLQLGSLEHESKDRACQARLMNLAFECGSLNGTLDDATRDAIRGFQKKSAIAENGTLDAATRNKLREKHEGA